MLESITNKMEQETQGSINIGKEKKIQRTYLFMETSIIFYTDVEL